MPTNVVAPSLEIEQDMAALRREWRFERAGWFIMAVLLCAAVAGLFGDGPLAHVSRRTAVPGTLVEYDRVMRYGASSALRFTIDARGPADTLAIVSVDRAYLASVDVERVTPEPAETFASSDRVTWQFRRTAAGRPVTIHVAFSPLGVGRLHPVVGTPYGPIDLHQFVLP